jgi:hypothetical protein
MPLNLQGRRKLPLRVVQTQVIIEIDTCHC